MIDQKIGDAKAVSSVLNIILPDVQVIVRDVARRHTALQASCTLININERPKLQIDFWRPDKQPLTGEEKKTIHAFPSLVVKMKLIWELDWVVVPRLDDAYSYLFWPMTGGVTHTKPQLDPLKIY